MCMCLCLHKVSSCVTLRCWEATGSPTAVGIRTGQVTACERPSFYLFALSVSSSLAHTHTLNRANRSVGLADRRCVSGVPTESSLHFPFIWRTFTCLSNAFTQFSDQPVSRLIWDHNVTRWRVIWHLTCSLSNWICIIIDSIVIFSTYKSIHWTGIIDLG